MIRCVVMDLDGTLLNHRKRITPLTKQALLKAQQLGVRLVLASGRMTEGVLPYARELEMDRYGGMVISHNGAKITDVQSGRVVYERCLDIEVAKQILRAVRNQPLYPFIDDGKGCLLVRDAHSHRLGIECRALQMPYQVIEDLDERLSFAPHKILISARPAAFRKRGDALIRAYRDQAALVYSAPFYLEVNATGVGKHEALTHIGIPLADMMTFGDADNDKGMLKQAGIGVAMGQATDDVKACADAVTDDCDHDGIAKALMKFHVISEIES